MKGERGQVLPLLGAAMLMALIVGFMLFQVGAAARLSTEGQTSADAAALAASNDVKRQIEELMLISGGGVTPEMIDWVRVERAGEDYARRNDAEITAFSHDQFDVLVTTRTLNGLNADAETVGREDAKAISRARARVEGAYSSVAAVGGLSGAGISGGGGAAGGSNFLSDEQLRDLSEKAGVPVRSDSALRRHGATGNGDGIDVADLQEPMQVAILRAEHALRGPVLIISGFRTNAYQAFLCASQGGLGGRCAAPGQSLHNLGLAIDVANHEQLAQVASEAGICQPFPGRDDDYAHFSIASGPECGGRGGALARGQAYGGSLSSFAMFTVRLVRYDGT